MNLSSASDLKPWSGDQKQKQTSFTFSVQEVDRNLKHRHANKKSK